MAARYVRRINDLHVLRPNGPCSCGIKRDCPTAKIIYERWPQQRIRDLDDEEARQAAYMSAFDADAEDEEQVWMHRDWNGPSQARDADIASADPRHP